MNKNKRNLFLGNALLLSAVNIIMRGIAVSFNAYINRKTGAEGMGLFTLVMSIYGFAVTLALSCVNLSSVRLTSERCAALESMGNADRFSWRYAMWGVIRSVCLYSLIFGVSAGVLLMITAEPAAKHLLHDMRTLPSLRILAFSLPAISLSSALSGYFTGMRKVTKNAFAAVSEQLVKITVTSTALAFVLPGNVESSCLALVGGSALSEAWTLSLNFILYITDSRRPAGMPASDSGEGKRILLETRLKDAAAISLPSAIGAYWRQGFTTLEHLAIPDGLKKSGLTPEKALSVYGLLQGVAFPLVMFPYAVIGSFTSLLIPEMAERKELGDREGAMKLTELVYLYSAVFSIGACGVFVNYSRELGLLVYDSSEAATYTLLLGLLVPFMYLDTAVDALLKGVGEQVYVMKVNIADAASGLVLVWLLTPRFGIYGYLISIWLCESFNLALSIGKLGKVTGVGIGNALKHYASPTAVCAVLSVMKKYMMRGMPSILSISIFILMYVGCVYAIKSMEKKEKVYHLR